MSSVKKVVLVGLFLVIKQLVFAQAQYLFPFQAVARYPNSGVIASKTIKVKFTILDSITNTPTVYAETQSVTTSTLGLFSVNVGAGTPISPYTSSTMRSLTWGTVKKLLKIEMDTLNTGVSYANLGTQQLLSVPYAINAASVGSLYTSGNNIGIGTTTPTNPLSVVGSADFSGDINVNGVTLGNGTGNISTNTACGTTALSSNTTGYQNTAIGTSSLQFNTSGYQNTANGYLALNANTTGNYNTATGNSSLPVNTTGEQNTANGFQSLLTNTTGGWNTAFGMNGLLSNTTGSYNTGIGFWTDVASGGLNYATAVGAGARVNASNTIQLGDGHVTNVATGGNIIIVNPNTVAINAAATAAASDIITGYITCVSAAAFNLTLPTVASIQTALGVTISQGTKINFEIDNSANTKIVTVVVNTGITAGTAVITGSTNLAVAAGAVGGFRLIFTSGTTAKLFRMY